MQWNEHFFDKSTEAEIIASGFSPGGWYAGRLLTAQGASFALRGVQEDSPAPSACMSLGEPLDEPPPDRAWPMVQDGERRRFIEVWGLDVSRPRIGLGAADQWVDRAHALSQLLEHISRHSASVEVHEYRARAVRCIVAVLRAQARRLLRLASLEGSPELATFVTLGDPLQEEREAFMRAMQSARVALVARASELAAEDVWLSYQDVENRELASVPTIRKRIREGLLDARDGQVSLLQLESLLAVNRLKQSTRPRTSGRKAPPGAQ